MSFSKIRLGSEEIFTTIVKDEDGRVIAKWTAMKKDFPQVVRILDRKFNLNIKVIDRKRQETNINNDLGWAL